MKNFNVMSAVVGAIVGALIAVALIGTHATPSQDGRAGTTNVTYSGALSRAETYNILSGFVTDLSATRAPLASMTSSSSVPVAPTFTRNTATSSNAGFAGLLTGDFCFVSVASGTTQVSETAEKISCYVTASTTVETSFFVPPAYATATAQVTYGLNYRILPAASFTAPAALTVATTSTP